MLSHAFCAHYVALHDTKPSNMGVAIRLCSKSVNDVCAKASDFTSSEHHERHIQHADAACQVPHSVSGSCLGDP